MVQGCVKAGALIWCVADMVRWHMVRGTTKHTREAWAHGTLCVHFSRWTNWSEDKKLLQVREPLLQHFNLQHHWRREFTVLFFRSNPERHRDVRN